jgi:hypothetical protein
MWGLCPIWSGGGVAPCTPSGALPLHPGQEKGGWAPLLSWQSLIRPLCTMRDGVPGHTLHGGPAFPCVSDCVRARRCTRVHTCAATREQGAAPGPSAAHECTMDGDAALPAAPGPSRTCASSEATRLGARCLWWLVETVAWPFAAGGWRLAAGGWRPAAGGWRLVAAARRDGVGKQAARPTPSRSWYWGVRGWERGTTRHEGMSFSRGATSYERPAPWPQPMHKCARDPALPWGPEGRHWCTSVQRWDPTLPPAPTVSSWVHRCAATGAHAVRHTRERGAPMERVAGHSVS